MLKNRCEDVIKGWKGTEEQEKATTEHEEGKLIMLNDEL